MRHALFTACFAALSPATASAAVSYALVAESSTVAWENEPAEVEIYLQETLTDGSTSLIDPVGLEIAGFRVDRAGGSGFVISDLLANPAFSPMWTTITVEPTAARLIESINLFSSPVEPVFFQSPGLVWLGTLIIDRDESAPLTATTFELGLYHDSVGNIGLADGTALDDPEATAYAAPTGGFSFTVVPEPASVVLLSLAACVTIRRRLRFISPASTI